jgi:two-component system, NarL family, response regulator DevR
VILLDHRMPDGDGVAAIPELRALRPTIGVVVLTASAADHVLMSAIENGASGFLSKTRSLDEVTAAVRAAAAGESVISPELLARLLPRFGRGKDTPEDELTDREREVLALVAEGLSNAAIAERLVVSVHTVRNHIASLSAKLGAHSKLEALSVAVRQGMLPDL